MSVAQVTCRVDEWLKRIEAHTSLQDLDGSCGLAHKRQGCGVSIVDEIWIEREGALKFCDGSVVGTIERSGIEIITIERLAVSETMSRGQHRIERGLRASGRM